MAMAPLSLLFSFVVGISFLLILLSMNPVEFSSEKFIAQRKLLYVMIYLDTWVFKNNQQNKSVSYLYFKSQHLVR